MSLVTLKNHLKNLKECSRCPKMIGPVVFGQPVLSEVLLIGQAPGVREGEFRKPFAWTAGKTLFKWFASLGISEEEFRSRVYMAAVCRCFPGKNPKGGDRVPEEKEIKKCSHWLEQEVRLLKPKLVIPVGKLAISQIVEVNSLAEIIGKKTKVSLFDHTMEMIALPHPSGASTWHRMEPGQSLLKKALGLIRRHESFKKILQAQ